jgi:hypothetical protein
MLRVGSTRVTRGVTQTDTLSFSLASSPTTGPLLWNDGNSDKTPPMGDTYLDLHCFSMKQRFSAAGLA